MEAIVNDEKGGTNETKSNVVKQIANSKTPTPVAKPVAKATPVAAKVTPATAKQNKTPMLKKPITATPAKQNDANKSDGNAKSTNSTDSNPVISTDVKLSAIKTESGTNGQTVESTKPASAAGNKSVSKSETKPASAPDTKSVSATDPKPASATDTKPATASADKKPVVKKTGQSTTTKIEKPDPKKPVGSKIRRRAFNAYGRICQIPVKDRTENDRQTFDWAKQIVKEVLGGDMTKYKLSQYTNKKKQMPISPQVKASSGTGKPTAMHQENLKRRSTSGSQLPVKRNRYDSPRGYAGGPNMNDSAEIFKQLVATIITSSGYVDDSDSSNNFGGGMNEMNMNMNRGNYNNSGPPGNGPYNFGPYNGGRPGLNSNNGNFNNFPPQFNNGNNNQPSFNNVNRNAPQSYPGNNLQNSNFSSNYSDSPSANNAYNYNTNLRNNAGSSFSQRDLNSDMRSNINNSNMANTNMMNMSSTNMRSNMTKLGGGGGNNAGAGIGFTGPNSNNQFVLAVIDRGERDFYISPAKWRAVEVKLTNVFLNILRDRPGPPPICRDGGWHQGRIKLINCADMRSAELYKQAISHIGELWRNAKLEAVPFNLENDGPIVNCFLPSEPRNPSAILQIIRTSNPNLSTGNWRIGKLEEPKGDSQFAIIQINQQSLEELGKCNFVINYGFSSIKLKLGPKFQKIVSARNINNANVYDGAMDNFSNSMNSHSRGFGQNYAY